MKRRKLLLLPVFLLLLAGCRDVSSSASVSVEDSTPPVTSTTTSEVDPSSEEPTSVSIEDTEAPPSVPVSEDPDANVVFKTIAEIRAMTEDGASATAEQKKERYKTSGVVTAKFRGANISGVGPAWNIAIQDGEHALLLYAVTEEAYAADFADVPVGAKLTVIGNLAAYNGLRELGTVKYVKHEAATPVEPETLTSLVQTGLAGKDSKLVKIEGLKLFAKPTLEAYMDGDRSRITLDMDLRKDDVRIGTYMHYNIPLDIAQATMEKLRTVTSNSTITWTGILGMNNKVFQLTNAHADEWDITVGDPVVLSDIAFKDALKTLAPEATYQTVVQTQPWDATVGEITYASDAPTFATIDATGLVTAVAVGTANITATASGKVATMVIKVEAAAEGLYNVTVKEGSATNEFTPETLLAGIEGYPEGMTVTATSKVYGITSVTALSSADSYTASTAFKFGTSGAVGSMTFKMPEGLEIGKVVIHGRSWASDGSSVSVNGVEQAMMPKGSDPNEIGMYVFDLATPATEVVIASVVKRIIIARVELQDASTITPPEQIEGSIAHFLAQVDGYTGTLEAVVTNMGPHNSFGMEDATGAIAFRKSGIDSGTDKFAVGDKVSGSFKKALFKGLYQAELQDAEPTVEKGPFPFPLPKVNLAEVPLTAEGLAPYQSRLVTGELLVKTVATKDGNGTISLLLTNGTNDITLRLDYRLPKILEFEFLMTLAVGDSVILNGAVIGWYNAPQLAADDPAQVTAIRQMTVANFLTQEPGTLAKLSAVITNMGPHSSFSMEDATAAIAFRKSGFDSKTDKFAVGDKVSGKFKLAVYKGLYQAELQDALPTVEVGPHALTLPKVNLGDVGLTAEALAPYQSRLVTGELTVVSFAKNSYGTYTITLTNGTTQIELLVDNRLPNYADFAYLETLVADDVVVLDGATITWYEAPRLAVDRPAQIVKKVAP
ncbi:MAG: Bacterial Ig-like domain (group 2) [Tenericutes bacterium ADurb.Bin024]|nr:MAG: Bacterial Ig-like domain (group 2) [Tenericutes bacterium ADurb.Bin024]